MKEKKSKKRILIKIVAAIVAFIVVISGVVAIANTVILNSGIKKAQSFPEVGCELNFEDKGNGVWNIYSDKEIKVLQLTDVHLGGGWMSTKTMQCH